MINSDFHIAPLSANDIQAMHANKKRARNAFIEAVRKNLNSDKNILTRDIGLIYDYFRRRGIHFKPRFLADIFNDCVTRNDVRDEIRSMYWGDKNAELIRFKPRYDSYLRKAKARREKLNMERILPSPRVYLPLPVSDKKSYARVKIESVLRMNYYKITDYRKGHATDDLDKQTFKIGKLLERAPSALKAFEHDYTRFPEKFCIVLSDDPDDIMRMSTGRAWRSCKKIDKAQNRDPIDDVAFDTMVAYLVKRSDPDICAPLARATIKSLVSRNWANHNVMYVADSFYGLDDDSFVEAVHALARDLTRMRCGVENPPGVYTKRKALVYEKEWNVFNTEDLETEQILKELSCNYEINEDGYFVTGSIDLSWMDLSVLPDLSRVIIQGNFLCNDNILSNLKGAPYKVEGDFVCSNNNLESLKGGPKVVTGTFNCSYNKLSNLKGGPKGTVFAYHCTDNKLLSLEGAPEIITDIFDIRRNSIRSRHHMPECGRGCLETHAFNMQMIRHPYRYGYKNE